MAPLYTRLTNKQEPPNKVSGRWLKIQTNYGASRKRKSSSPTKEKENKTMTRYSELMNKAIETLKEDARIFVYCIDELDSWNGYADGFRAYDMCEINDIFYGVKVSDFLDKLAPGFHHTDEYFYDSIYGIDSCDDKEALYRDNVDEGDLVDALMEEYLNIDLEWIDEDFDKIIRQLNEILDATER